MTQLLLCGYQHKILTDAAKDSNFWQDFKSIGGHGIGIICNQLNDLFIVGLLQSTKIGLYTILQNKIFYNSKKYVKEIS